MARARIPLFALVSALLLAVLTACGSDSDSGAGAAITDITTYDDDGYHGIFLDEPYAVADLKLTDTEGNPFSLFTEPRRTLVFFGYTHCPDICQVVMSTIASAMTRLSESERAKLHVAFVTTDPARDTGRVLRAYLDRFGPGFIGLTGSLSRIVALARPMGIAILDGEKLPSGGYEVAHTTNVVAVRGARGDLVWTAATSPADMATDLRKILKADA